jgi:DNA ligase-1
MPDLADGESIEMQGSGRAPYVLKNTGGVYSCSCPAWRNQSVGIERRTCKHLRKLRGDAAETERVGSALPVRRVAAEGDEEATDKAPPLLLAHVWENDIDLSGWWMSEKLDGVRAYWDGAQFMSRLGNIFHAPDWFTAGLPQSPLDGELWVERKSFQQTVSIVRRQDQSDHWKQIRYLVFDAPAQADPFEERLKFIAELLAAAKLKYARPHEHQRCRDLDHLQAELQRVESLGGEGLMLRQPGSKYEAGRSTTLLKVKTFHDAEAVVVDHVAGKGRHKGRLGALVVNLPDGTEFSVGTGFSDKQRESPPAVGSTITFRYQELSTGGVPRFPSFVRMRKDAETAARAAPSKAAQPTAGAKATIKISSTATTAGPPVTPEPSSGAPARRYFEFVEGNSSKFWEIARQGTEVTVRFGRIGANGQTQTKSFGDEERAAAHAEKLIGEKTDKGYIEKSAPGG